MWALRVASRTLTRSAPLCRRGVATTAALRKDAAAPDAVQPALTRKEMLAQLASKDDLFDMKLRARGEGSRENPDLIPSMFSKRIVGHICEEDQTYITWFWLYKGRPKCCRCGHWFKLIDAEPL